ILVGQLGPLFGFTPGGEGFFRRLASFVLHLNETHVVTLATGVGLFIVLRALKHAAPRIPAPLVVVVVAIAAAYFLDLQQQGVTVVGAVPGGFPVPRVPTTV